MKLWPGGTARKEESAYKSKQKCNGVGYTLFACMQHVGLDAT